jgi:hypothetical protein
MLGGQSTFYHFVGHFMALSNCIMSMTNVACVLLHSGLAGQDLTPMSLGLSHSLSRYKLKFSPDKVPSLS